MSVGQQLRWALAIGGLALLWAGRLAWGAERPLPERIDFNRDVRPIFSANCYACHGPDKNKRKADLRLDTHDGLFATHEGRIDVAPGDAGRSELFRRITAADPAERMPDPKSNKRLSDRQIAVIRRWIEQGAPWKGHWAYLKPERPALPAVDDPAFVRDPVDPFILAGLKEAGLHHAPEADRRTLIRRLSFDLRGLPPTAAEVRAFEQEQSPNAYEALVDRYLASPQYGEHMAVGWLDLVRYADSIGYHSDNPMNVWPYRDWVIRAFNRNEPFDQFTREQLAGDLLPGATQDQRIASAYNRLIESTEEGGAQPKEYEVKYETDRVRDFSTVWLAGTMGCCQCHDHKFDPYTQKDFYSLAAFFGDIREAAVGRREPGMPVTNDAQAAELKQIDSSIADANHTLETDTPELVAARERWEAQQGQKVEWTTLEPREASVSGESKLRHDADGVLHDIYKVAARETYQVDASTDVKGVTGLRLEAMDDADFPAHGPGTAPNGNFVLTDFKATADALDADGHPAGKAQPVKFRSVTADHAQGGYPAESLIDHAKGMGWAILPETGKPHTAVFEAAEPIAGGAGGARLSVTLAFNSPFPQHNIGKFRLSVTTAPSPASQSLPAEVRAALAVAPDHRDDAQRHAIATYYRTVAPALQDTRDALVSLEKRKADLLASFPKCLVSESGAPREVRFLHRGNCRTKPARSSSPPSRTSSRSQGLARAA